MARWSPAVLDRASLENFFAVIENDDAIDDAHQDRHHVLDPNDADPEFYADSAKHVGRLIHLGNIEAAETLVPRAGSPAAWRARASSSFFKGAGSSTSVLSPSLVDRCSGRGGSGQLTTGKPPRSGSPTTEWKSLTPRHTWSYPQVRFLLSACLVGRRALRFCPTKIPARVWTLLACIFGSRRRRNLRRGDGTDAMPYVERVVLPGVRNG
jgi:hypothetical protein